MIKHIVLWKLKEIAEGRSKIENIKLVKEMLENLVNKIPQIAELEVGININPNEKFDLVLYSLFHSEEDFKIYSNHPDHEPVKDFIGKVRLERCAVDYYLPS